VLTDDVCMNKRGFFDDRFDTVVGGRPSRPRGWLLSYFLGVPFQVGLTSMLVGGVSRDSELVVRHLLQRNFDKSGVRTGFPVTMQR